MRLVRIAPDGLHAVFVDDDELRTLYSDPYETPVHAWRLGPRLDPERVSLLAPVVPGKLVGIGRSYGEHARELGNPVPGEPVLFLKATSSVIGPRCPIVLPPESAQVEYEGEIAVVIGRRLRRASGAEVTSAVLGVTAACDVTARDLQRRDPCFARAKSFDTFCPLGPAVWVGAPLDELTVETRVNGQRRQHGATSQMLWPLPEMLAYASRMMTLDPGDVVLTGTPAGVGPLADGDTVEVEVSGVGTIVNPVECWRQAPAEASR